MPIYEYECTTCQYQFDEVQKMNDPVLTHCPNCSQETAIRLVSAASFQLKGDGWYVTDFKDKGQPKPKTEANTAPKKAETKTDAKGGDN